MRVFCVFGWLCVFEFLRFVVGFWDFVFLYVLVIELSLCDY